MTNVFKHYFTLQDLYMGGFMTPKLNYSTARLLTDILVEMNFTTHPVVFHKMFLIHVFGDACMGRYCHLLFSHAKSHKMENDI
jgi:hypothetical protein